MSEARRSSAVCNVSRKALETAARDSREQGSGIAQARPKGEDSLSGYTRPVISRGPTRLVTARGSRLQTAMGSL